MRSCLIALVLGGLVVRSVPAADLRNFEDAPLHAVQFADDNEGWAVGDEGVIWHTIDGGQNWERQPSGVRASLRSLHFLNPYTGWIAGREELPHGKGSIGVLLFTRDGGLKWQRIASNSMPGLERVRFVDGRTGFAVGDGTDQFPSGIFRTTDSGRTWKPVAGPRAPGWLAAEFQDASTGTLVGAWSRLGVLRQGAVGKADMDDTLGGRAIRDVQVVGNRAFAVGQGGLVLRSRDTAGARWGYVAQSLPSEVRRSWDFHAVHCVGDQVWAVGRPGSAVLHSADQGETWHILRSGQTLPLNGVYFASGQKGWAVGELGSILHTEDGGKSWRVQQRGGQRAAVMLVHARGTGLPLDAVAQFGADDGYLTTAVEVASPDSASAAPAHASDPQRLSAALRQAGGVAGEMLWQFPVPRHLEQAGKTDLLQAWNTLHGDQAGNEMLRQLVLAIRTWRPSLLLTDHPDLQVTGRPAEALVSEAVHEAFRLAADPNAFSEQIQQLGLEPWEVAKSYCRWPTAAGGQVAIDLSQISARLEGTPREFATPAYSLLTEAPTPLAAQCFFHLLDSRISGAEGHRNLFQGIDLTPGGVARRKQTELATLTPEVEQALRTRRNLQTLAEAPPGQVVEPNRLLAQVGPMLAKMPENQAAPAAFAVASQFARAGQWVLAREVFLLMVDRYPAHPLAADAYRWLIRYNSSSEARRRQELGQFWVETHATVQPGKGYSPGSNVEMKQLPEQLATRQLNLLGSQDEVRKWFQGSLEIGTRLAGFGPLYVNDPAMQFCLQSARRQLGDFDKAREWYAKFHTEQPDGPWRDAAAGEVWLSNRVGLPPKPVAVCRQTVARPFLDGEFKEECWQEGKPLVLRNAVGDTVKDYPTEVRLAYDKDFLYMFLSCKHPADRYVAPIKVRQQDADLRPFDRVSLLLDLDRDYSTYFRLEVDQRGCVCEDCWGDKTWNPRWFVAVHSRSDGWQIEAAIPLVELTGDHLTPGRTWACNVVRTLPGRGVQAWSLPADAEPRPEGMGLLMFLPHQPGTDATTKRE